MNDLFKKFNTLVKSRVNDVIGEVGAGLSDLVPSGNPRNKLDRDIDALRERINQAIAHEDVLQERVKTLQQEIMVLDQQADDAVKQGNDALARHIIEKIQRTQQHLAMAEADLRQHQIVAQELIQNVNKLEATVADIRHEEAAQRAQPPQPAPTETETAPATDQTSASEHPAVVAVTRVINEARDRITSLNDKVAAQQEVNAALNNPEVQEEIDKAAVDDDLSARRSRLSK